MNLTIGSAFRNSERTLRAYLERVCDLSVRLRRAGHALSASWVWGDSTDRTRTGLDSAALDLVKLGYLTHAIVTEHSHGGPVWGSTEQPERMAALSGVGNAVLDGVPPQADALFYVESDLLWTPDVPLTLMAQLSPRVDVIAPLIMAGTCFYDIWGFRTLDGERFSPGAHTKVPSALIEVSSVGSAFVATGRVARQARMTTGALVEWCADARRHGARIWVDPRLVIQHPA